MADKPSLGKTRAGTKADPFPWEEALEAQLGRTKKRLKGLVTDPKQELLNITRQYLPSPTDAPEERDRKLEELALGLTGTPIKGVKPYGVAQEGAFYRVSPEIARRNAARTRGNLEPGGESAEVTGGAPRGDVPELFSGQTYQELTGSQNFPLEIADEYTRRRMSRPYSLPSMSESSLAKQSAIGKTFELAATDNPQYKKAVFSAYKRKYPKIVEQANAKDYDDLLEKSYLQLAKETEEQFKQLPINMSYHRAGEGNYRSSAEMLHDVHKNRHLYVFQGGDPHDFLNRIDPDTGLNTNEMFRAVHDFFGHAVHGTQFGPKGEELAWLAHSQMYSPLARLAMTSETRGQNSFVNYTPINAELKRAISNIEEELYEARRRGRDADVQRLEQLKSGLFNEFQFAPQKSVLLPPEFTTHTFEGGMPSYIQPLIEPKAGTTTQTPLTHFSTSPDILMTDPRKYGTGIAGEEAARLQGVQGAVRPRTYFYAGEPGSVTPEVGLGPYRYRAEGESLYNLAEDPLSLRTLATEANRIPFTAIANAGTVRGAQAMADLERMIKEYGYEGYLQPGGSAPAAAVFTPKAVQRKANGGLATGGQAFPLQEDFQTEIERRAARPRTRAGVPVEDTNVLGGALQGLGETLVGGGRGALATMLGAPADILNLLNVKQFGTPDIPYGSEFFKESLPLAPTTQTGKTAQQLGEFLPINPEQPVQAGVAGARRAGKALAPTMADMLEAQLQKTGMMMPIAPEGKAAKIKAPANDVGFYNPAEKAALNLQRKKGTGDAFLADMKKQPGVTDERLAELGLDQFKGKPNVTREEIIAATEQNRIPLQESVKKDNWQIRYDIDELEDRNDEILEAMDEARASGRRHELAQLDAELQDNIASQKALKSVEGARFSPSDYPDYSMPGGTDYREIRIKLPNTNKKEYAYEWFDPATQTSKKFATEAEAKASAPEGAVIQKTEISESNPAFYHQQHHGDEPNVLLHLRVANHADADGKNGLLIDELQSDWHQQGSKSGYAIQMPESVKSKVLSLEKQLDDLETKNKEQKMFSNEWVNNVNQMDEIGKEIAKIRKSYPTSGVPDAPFKDNWYQLGLKRAIKEAVDTGMDRVYLTTGARQADRYDLSKQVDQLLYDKNPDGTYMISAITGSRGNMLGEAIPEEKLADYVGKEIAEKMTKGEGARTQVQGDRPYMQSLSGGDLKVGGEGMKQWYDKTYKNYLEKYAKQHGSKLGTTTIADGEPVYYIDITDAMRESAKKGQSYKEGGAVHPAVEKFATSLPHPAVTEFVAKLADGGGVWKAMVDGKYNTVPDTSDAERIIQGPAFAEGGGVWKQLVEGAGNA